MPLEPWEIRTARFVKSAVRRAHYPDDGLPQIAFAGRSNVGKSSLLNLLVRMKGLARTSRTPGLTQQINFFLVNDGHYYVDLPGYGYAKAPASVRQDWGKMMEEYFPRNRTLRLVVVLLDCRRTPSDLDDQLVDYLAHHQIPFLLALTKSDKLSQSQVAKTRNDIARHFDLPTADSLIPVSAPKSKGRETLLQRIHEALETKS